MALCSEACVSGSGGESSGSEAGSSCLQFGVRSYLHHFYEECSSSMWERDPEDRGFVQSQRSALLWNSAVWKVSLALGLLILTAGIASLSVGYSTPHKIESFGEGDLFFVDTQAVSFNRGLHLSAAAGTRPPKARNGQTQLSNESSEVKDQIMEPCSHLLLAIAFLHHVGQ